MPVVLNLVCILELCENEPLNEKIFVLSCVKLLFNLIIYNNNYNFDKI